MKRLGTFESPVGKRGSTLAALWLFGMICTTTWAAAQPAPWTPEARALIIVIDGLRPDYITDEVMPNLAALRDGGFAGERHHAVFPTVTRVNAPSIATGSYPRTHGLMGNALYVESVRPDRPLDTGAVADMRLLDAASQRRLLTTPSLGELLQQQGRRLFASSSGSSGSAFLLNHRGGGGALVHHEYVLPDTLAPFVEALLGPVPAQARPRLGLVRRAVDAVLKVGIDYVQADALILWITEPDGTAHAEGIGAPLTVEALRGVDAEVGRLLTGLDVRGLRTTTDLFVTSDHGFSTHLGRQSLVDLLVEHRLKASATSPDVIVAGGAIHVREGGPERVRAIVRRLQQTAWIGPIFTRSKEASSVEGWVRGTLSFASILWDHDRSADILTAGAWTAETNRFGYKGAVRVPGVAGHGSASPYDIRATFIASGPSIKQGIQSRVPTGNVDLTPTVLHLLGVPLPVRMEGRVLAEALAAGPSPSAVQVQTRTHVAESVGEGKRYRLVLHTSSVGHTTYVDYTEVTRDPN